MSPANCSNCRHHVGEVRGRDHRRECRAQPPSFAREIQTPAYGAHPIFLACWPLTLPGDGCGNHLPIPRADPAEEASDQSILTDAGPGLDADADATETTQDSPKPRKRPRA